MLSITNLAILLGIIKGLQEGIKEYKNRKYPIFNILLEIAIGATIGKLFHIFYILYMLDIDSYIQYIYKTTKQKITTKQNIKPKHHNHDLNPTSNQDHIFHQ
jgi:hypothetical protein